MKQLRIHDFKRLNATLQDWKNWRIESTRPPEVIKPIYGELSCHNFLIKCGTHKIVARLNNPLSTQLGICRNTEIKILKAIKNKKIGNEFIYWFQPGDVSLFKYVEGDAWTEKELRNNFSLLENVVRQYQSTDIELPHIRYDQYLSSSWLRLAKKHPETCQNMSLEWKRFYSRLVSFCRKNQELTLCHHNLIAKHIIQSEQGIKIINWEHAGLGHPALDFIYVGIEPENKYQDTEFIREIIRWMNTLWRYLNNSQALATT